MAGGVEQYRSRLRAAVRGLWSGALDAFDAWDAMDIAIRGAFTRAYQEGAQSVGVQPSELLPEEKQALRAAIQRETNYIDGFLDAIEAGSKENGGKLGPLFSRIDRWVARYQQMYTDGQMTAKENPKLKWIWNPEAEHCTSCEKLQGKIKRHTQWQDAGVYPQAPVLECMVGAHGVTVCKCHFEPTDEPMSKGPLPRI